MSDGTSAYTGTTFTHLDLDQLKKFMEQFNKADGEWWLFAPDGRAWKGTLKDITFTAAMMRLNNLTDQEL